MKEEIIMDMDIVIIITITPENLENIERGKVDIVDEERMAGDNQGGNSSKSG